MPSASADAHGSPRGASGRLWVVATPLGNLGDITERAKAELAACDLVACEDTRVTGGLLRHLGLTKPMLAYHEHNEKEVAVELADKVERVAKLAEWLASEGIVPNCDPALARQAGLLRGQ